MTASEPSPRDTLLRMTNAFQVSQGIHVAATLGIADLLEDGPRSADELAEATHTHAPMLYQVLRALASVGVFVEETDSRFGLTPLAEHLRKDATGSLRAWAKLIGQPYFWSARGTCCAASEPAIRPSLTCTGRPSGSTGRPTRRRARSSTPQ